MSSAPPPLIDRSLLAARLRRRAPDAEDFVTPLVLADLMDRLSAVSRAFAKAIILGPEGARLPAMAASAAGPFALARASTLVGSDDAPLVDPENLRLEATGYDLVVSLLDLQAVNDVPGYLARARAHLAPDGLFMAAVLGGATLGELRQAFLAADTEVNGGAFARVIPFLDVRDAGALLQRAGFALPVADIESHVVRYGDPITLMAEVKALGASNPLADRPARLATRTLVAGAIEAYRARYSDPDGKVRASLEIVWLSGWAPHDSQQQPLAPGSARVSLASVLGKEG